MKQGHDGGPDEMLTLEAAAERAGVTSSALRHAIRNGRLTATAIGTGRRKLWQVRAGDLEAYLDSRPEWWVRGHIKPRNPA